MKPDFAGLVSRMEPLLDELVAAKRVRVEDCGLFPKAPGVYVLSEDGNDLYVGRTKSLRDRMRGHGSKSHYSASFALKLAREKANRLSTYTTQNSARALMAEDHFIAVFHSMVERVRKMEARFIEEQSDHIQYLFEMFAALSLNVPYCDFATH